MLKETMTQELQNVRTQSAKYQQEIATHESRIKDLQAGVQRLHGAEMMLTHLLNQEEQKQKADEAEKAKEVILEAAPPAQEAEVVELKKPKTSKKKSKKSE